MTLDVCCCWLRLFLRPEVNWWLLTTAGKTNAGVACVNVLYAATAINAKRPSATVVLCPLRWCTTYGLLRITRSMPTAYGISSASRRKITTECTIGLPASLQRSASAGKIEPPRLLSDLIGGLAAGRGSLGTRSGKFSGENFGCKAQRTKNAIELRLRDRARTRNAEVNADAWPVKR